MSSLLNGRKPQSPRCSACETWLQPLDPTSSWRVMAVDLCSLQGIHNPKPLMLALVAHTAIVHDDLEELPHLLT